MRRGRAKTVLAIDCSFGGHSVAVLDARRGLLAQRHRPRTYPASGIIDSIDRSLREAGLRLGEMDLIAFGAGPGLFSGIRAACSAAQGMAFVHRLPVAAVPTPQAVAQACAKRRALVAYPAHQGHCYVSALTRIGMAWRYAVEPTLASIKAIPRLGGDWELCGRRLHLLERACRAAAQGSLERLPSLRGSLAPSVAELALILSGRKDALVEAKDARPHYVRMKVAHTREERMAMRQGA